MNLAERCRRFAELPQPNQRKLTFLGALKVQLRVTTALMMRGALMRYGHENLGFFWLIGRTAFDDHWRDGHVDISGNRSRARRGNRPICLDRDTAC